MSMVTTSTPSRICHKMNKVAGKMCDEDCDNPIMSKTHPGVVTFSDYGATERSNSQFLSLRVIICSMLFIAFVFVVSLFLHGCGSDNIGVLELEYSSGKVYVFDRNSGRKSSYLGQFGINLKGDPPEFRQPTENGVEYTWENGVTLRLERHTNENCTSLQWRGLAGITPIYPVDCFELKKSQWYGGAELYEQAWPLNGAQVNFAPYYPQDILEAFSTDKRGYGPVLGRYWISSDGVAILVNQTIPLVVGLNASNSGLLCLTVDPDDYPGNFAPILNYTICKNENVKAVHQAMLAHFIKKPSNGPDERMMRDPVWSTWVKYGKDVNQNDVEQFLDDIVSHNFTCSQIEIDDMYSTAYGDYDFDPVKFPNPKAMIDKIHKSGCRVTTWVYPLANVGSKAYFEGKSKGYFVAGPDGKSPAFLFWWDGIAMAIDFTKPSARNWFSTRLKSFQENYGIDSFKFDAGSPFYLPYMYHLNGSNVPSQYSVDYATLASEINNMVEVRVGDNSQDLALFVRFLDRAPNWSLEMGLQSVIPTVLTFGILGYPFILPDMIGGNGNTDKELFIRWLQLNTFLPAMQFSHSPWDFDNETVAIAHDMMKIRTTIFPTLLDGVSNAVKTGEPIIRPLWWIAPDDPKALTASEEFLVMDDYLVAPVVKPGVTSIDIYLPKGKWLEQFGSMKTHNMDEGGSVVYNNITLSDVFYFKNVTSLLNY